MVDHIQRTRDIEFGLLRQDLGEELSIELVGEFVSPRRQARNSPNELKHFDDILSLTLSIELDRLRLCPLESSTEYLLLIP